MVHHRTFVSGDPVETSFIRDARVEREIATAPVVRGPIAIAPTELSIRVSREGASAPRPPARTLQRAVVTRRAPPPAPARFRATRGLIRENRGVPLTPADALRVSTEGLAIVPTRPVIARGGRVELAPKNARGAGPAPVAVTGHTSPGRARREVRPAERERTSAGPGRAPTPRTKVPPERAEAARRSQGAERQMKAEGARQARPEARARQADEKRKAAEKAKPAKDRKKEKKEKGPPNTKR
jgi:hypothetical protein